jgi:hypothetical protein
MHPERGQATSENRAILHKTTGKSTAAPRALSHASPIRALIFALHRLRLAARGAATQHTAHAERYGHCTSPDALNP